MYLLEITLLTTDPLFLGYYLTSRITIVTVPVIVTDAVLLLLSVTLSNILKTADPMSIE
jgi:hypothetical protein